MGAGLQKFAGLLIALAATCGLAVNAQESGGLPTLPATPVLQADGYPKCREDYQARPTPLDRAVAINRCTELIDAFYQQTLLGYRNRMIAHQTAISRLYSDQVARRQDIPAKDQQDFYARMRKEHADSDPDGAHQAGYRALEARYQADRAYLRDRFCFNTGCGGYAAPAAVAAKPAKAAKASTAQTTAASGKSNKCRKARKTGSVLGGLIGSVAGSAAGLKGTGSLLAGGFSGLLVGEIACQLTEKEQVKAEQATVEVVKKEEVGAVSTWQSPTRAGVSGSSTVTAVNAAPNGNKCLSITDVAIIDGAETRVQKQMCRKPGESGYTLVA